MRGSCVLIVSYASNPKTMTIISLLEA
jgi:hypothetical protein